MNILNIMNFLFKGIYAVHADEVENTVKALASPVSFNSKFWIKMGEDWLDKIINFGVRVIIAIVIFIVARWIITRLLRIFRAMLLRRKVEGIAFTLLDSIMAALMYIILFILLASVLGVKSVSFAAILASMGLAVGMALSGQLQNLAGGVIILFTKPFKIDDHIKSEDVDGVVKAVTLFHTQICTFDNKMIFIPNSKLSSGIVTNYSHHETRRCEWTIGIEYNEDFDKAKSIVLEILNNDSRILSIPEPTCVLGALADSSVNLLIRGWTASGDLWPVYWDINRAIYVKFNEVGIGFPFPQLTVHNANK